MRQSLQNIGGPVELWGDPEASKALGHAMSVDPDTPLGWTHTFHAYPARMHPETARRILESFAPKRPDIVVLDPFVGAGTTAVEAVRLGFHFIGVDVSRVPLEIAWTKTRVMPPEKCRRIELEGNRIQRVATRDVNLNFPKPAWAEKERAWYSPHTLREICLVKNIVDTYEDGSVRRMLTCVLSSILIKLSKQSSDSVPAADAEFKPWIAGTTFRLFQERCAELTKCLLLLSGDLYKRGVAFVEPYFRLEDARTFFIEAETVDLVVTSPPYPATYDYALQHTRRYPIFDDDGRFAIEHEMGARRNLRDWPDGLRRYRLDLESSLRILIAALKPAGKLAIMIGDGAIGEHPIFTDRMVKDVAATLGARVKAGASQSRLARSRERRREHLILIERG